MWKWFLWLYTAARQSAHAGTRTKRELPQKFECIHCDAGEPSRYSQLLHRTQHPLLPLGNEPGREYVFMQGWACQTPTQVSKANVILDMVPSREMPSVLPPLSQWRRVKEWNFNFGMTYPLKLNDLIKVPKVTVPSNELGRKDNKATNQSISKKKKHNKNISRLL